jgi:hypothetical protein
MIATTKQHDELIQNKKDFGTIERKKRRRELSKIDKYGKR